MNLVDIVLGAQLGDEGKGRLVDILAPQYDIVARCNSGGNAGHKVVVDGYTYSFHLVPSGILNPNVIGIIGNGCVINLQDLKTEIETIQFSNPNINNIKQRIFISDRAHIVLELHKESDSNRELMKTKLINKAIGTTKQGMGPVYATKALRVGLRMCDLFLDYDQLKEKLDLLIDELILTIDNTIPKSILITTLMTELQTHTDFYRPLVIDTISYINNAIKLGKKILVEGAQATLLDIDFGVYPYCTATNCTAGSICTGLGIPPSLVGTVNYVIKTYCTRVGNGPFPTEQINEIGEQLQEIGHEYGTTTGRRRRCGWLDIPMIKWAIMINGTTNAQICITKLDVFDTFDEIKIATKYIRHSNDTKNVQQELISSKENSSHIMSGFPASLETLAKVIVEYETFPGWLTSTKDIKNYNNLPSNAKNYLSRIEELLQIPIKWIGVGPERDTIITK